MSVSSPLDIPRRGSNTGMSTRNGQSNQGPSTPANTSSPIASSNVSTSPDQALAESEVPDAQQKHASQLQIDWNEAICRNMELPEGYAQVAVLIIDWAEHLDQLKTRKEVLQLRTLLQDEFRYETEVVSLCESSPTHQLRGSVSGFLEKYDKPNNLLIIYYTGHSQWNEDTNTLEFWAKPGVPYVQWKVVDTLFLEECSADTLAILDTCYASNHIKGGLHSGRTYQLLAASGYNRGTAGPGVKSFTAALIVSLEECLQEGTPFTVYALLEKINRGKYRRENPAQHYHLLGTHSRHILLAPLNRDKGEREKTEQKLNEHRGIADLVLRFNLDIRALNKDHIEELSKQLPKVFTEIGLSLRRIELDGFERSYPPHPKFGAQAMAVLGAKRWLMIARKRGASTAHTNQSPLRKDDIRQSNESFTPPPISAIEDEDSATEPQTLEKTAIIKPGFNLGAFVTRHLLLGITVLSIGHFVAHLYLSWRGS